MRPDMMIDPPEPKCEHGKYEHERSDVCDAETDTRIANYTEFQADVARLKDLIEWANADVALYMDGEDLEVFCASLTRLIDDGNTTRALVAIRKILDWTPELEVPTL